VDGEGEVLLEGDDDAAASQFPAPDALQPRVAAEGGVFDAAGQDGRRRTYAIVPVVQGRLAVLAAQPVRTLTMDRLDLWISVAVPLLIWLLAILTMWIGLERLVLRWLSYLQRVGAGYAGGHYIVMPHRVEDAPLEFRALGDTLSRMAQTARARQQELRSALEQKNVLVREIHHRVKNNLQIIQSLLNLQSRSAADSNQFTALAAAKSRINALALVHQSLYEDENLQYVNLRQFLNDLCRHLLQSGWGAAKRVGVRVDVPELSTTAEQAVPIALLVTEAVTNALKHAFFGRDAGTITVTMTNDPVAGGTLIIADNGIGMETVPKAAGRQAGQGIGYSLIEGFARQLRGQVQTTSENGTRVIVTFPYLKGRESTS
jgi:two-component sensor histidine kinase